MNPAHLARLLDHYPGDCRPLGPIDSLGNAGGLSGSRLWRFESRRGPLVARAWPAGRSESEIATIHGWLRSLADLPFVPQPLRTNEGWTVVPDSGRLWELGPWMPGRPDLEHPPDLARVRAGFAGLALVHHRLARLGSTCQSPGLRNRLDEVESLRNGGFDRLRRILDASPPDRRRDLALCWLSLAVPLALGVAGALRWALLKVVPIFPCLRDARPDHFLFEGSRLTGLIDFGAMDLESPTADLARLLCEWVEPDRTLRAEALDAYAAVRMLTAEEWALIDVFERSTALLMGGHWIVWHFLEGREFDDPSAVRAGLERGVERLTRLAVRDDRRVIRFDTLTPHPGPPPQGGREEEVETPEYLPPSPLVGEGRGGGLPRQN